MANPKLVFSMQKLLRNARQLKTTANEAFSGRTVNLYYSMKANYNEQVTTALFKFGINAEAGRLFELNMVPSNFKQKIIINGHYKSDEFIENAIGRQVTRIHVESMDELKRVEHIAAKLKIQINVGVRIKLESERKVGADLTELKKISELKSNFATIKALHFHLGWNEQDQKFAQNSMNLMLDAYTQLKSNGHDIDTFNFGGSLIEPSTNPGQAHQRLKQFAQSVPKDVTQIELEPGRYYVGDCGILYARVVEVRDSCAILNTCAYGYRLTGATPAVQILSVGSRRSLQGRSLVLSGHWASENDRMTLPSIAKCPRVGDVVKFCNYGAYLDSWFDQLCLDSPLNYSFEHPYDLLFELLEDIQFGAGSILAKHWDFARDEIATLPKSRSDMALLLAAIQKWLATNTSFEGFELNLRLIYHDYSTLRRELIEASRQQIIGWQLAYGSGSQGL